MHWADEEFLANEWLHGHPGHTEDDESVLSNEWLHGYLGQYEAESTPAANVAPPLGPYRPAPKPKPYVDYRQLVKQATQPVVYAPAAITPGLQAALRAQKSLITRAPTPVRKSVVYRMPAQAAEAYTPVVQAALTQAPSVVNTFVPTPAVQAAQVMQPIFPPVSEVTVLEQKWLKKIPQGILQDYSSAHNNRPLYGAFFAAHKILNDQLRFIAEFAKHGYESTADRDSVANMRENIQALRAALSKIGKLGTAERYVKDYLALQPSDSKEREAWEEAGTTFFEESYNGVMTEIQKAREKYDAAQEQAVRAKQGALLGPRVPTAAEQMLRVATSPVGVASMAATVDAFQDVKAKARTWASSFFGGDGK